MPRDRGVDDRRALVQVPPGDRGVTAPDPTGGDGGAEPAVGQIGLGDDHEPRRIAIEAMHDAGAPFGSARQGRSARDQGVDQGVVPVAGGRMNDETGRLVDDREVLVLEEYVERDGGGLKGAGRLVLGEPDDDGIAAGEQSGCAGRCPIHRHRAVGDQPGRLGAGKPQLIGEEAVEPLGRRDRDRECQLRQPRPTPFRGGGSLPAREKSRAR